MKIFVDENIPLITVKELCEQGFDVIDIRGTDYPPQTADPVKDSSTRYAVNKKIFRKRMVRTHGCYA